MFKNELIQAAANGETLKVSDLLKNNKSININDYNSNNGNTAIHVAASNGFLDIVKLLVEAGCRYDQTDNSTCTPLFKAALSGHGNVVQYLIEKGANVNRQNKLLETPLYALTESISQIAENGSGGLDGISGNVELKQKINTIEIILKNGGSYGTTNNGGKLPIMMAAKSRIPQLVQLFIDYNSDPNKKDNLGLSSFDYANGDQTIIKILNKELKYTNNNNNSTSTTTSTSNPQCSCGVPLSILAKYCSTCGLKV